MSQVAFDKWISVDGEHPPQANRYHLYVSYGCPFAGRALCVYHSKGVEEVVGLSVAHPVYQPTKPTDPGDPHVGWVFRRPDDPPVTSPLGLGSFSCEGCVPDPVNNLYSVREVYESCGHSVGRFSVPLLYDKVKKCIVSNDSGHIAHMLNSQFNAWAKNPSLDLCPRGLAEVMAETDQWVGPHINWGVYDAGMARTQAEYEKAIDSLYSALDRAEALLSGQRFLCGDEMTLCDIKLFMSLVRFNPVYVGLFKCNRKDMRDYPNLRGLMRDVYHSDGVHRAVNMRHIKVSYYASFTQLNPSAIVPVGGEVDLSLPGGPSNRQ